MLSDAKIVGSHRGGSALFLHLGAGETVEDGHGS